MVVGIKVIFEQIYVDLSEKYILCSYRKLPLHDISHVYPNSAKLFPLLRRNGSSSRGRDNCKIGSDGLLWMSLVPRVSGCKEGSIDRNGDRRCGVHSRILGAELKKRNLKSFFMFWGIDLSLLKYL